MKRFILFESRIHKHEGLPNFSPPAVPAEAPPVAEDSGFCGFCYSALGIYCENGDLHDLHDLPEVDSRRGVGLFTG